MGKNRKRKRPLKEIRRASAKVYPKRKAREVVFYPCPRCGSWFTSLVGKDLCICNHMDCKYVFKARKGIKVKDWKKTKDG